MTGSAFPGEFFVLLYIIKKATGGAKTGDRSDGIIAKRSCCWSIQNCHQFSALPLQRSLKRWAVEGWELLAQALSGVREWPEPAADRHLGGSQH